MTKICSLCQIKKEEKEFNKRRVSKDGLQHRCKICQAELAKKRNYKSLYTNYNRSYSIRVKYNLEEEDYNNLISKGCSICKSNTKIVLDHDHRTGEIRGPLCHKCNTALGLFDDDITKLSKAINYLKNKGE